MKRSFRNKRVLITGANGFIAKELIDYLHSHQAILYVFDRNSVIQPKAEKVYCGDIGDRVYFKRCVTDCNPQYVFHLAAYKPRTTTFDDFYEAIDINIRGSLSVLEALQGCSSLISVVMAGTAEEYGDNFSPYIETQRERPQNAYSFSKNCMTKLSETIRALYDIPVIIARPSLAYGPGQGNEMFLPSLITSLLAGEEFKMTSGEQKRDFLFIDDLVNGLAGLALSTAALGKIVNLSSNSSIKISSLAKMVHKLIGKGRISFGSIPYRSKELMEYKVSNKNARILIGWEPTVPLEIGILRTIDWYSNRSEE